MILMRKTFDSDDAEEAASDEAASEEDGSHEAVSGEVDPDEAEDQI